MFDVLKPLLDSGMLNEDAKKELQEAWDSKLTEAREQIRTEIREEFATRYNHDKDVMVEALDRMVTDTLTEAHNEVINVRKTLEEDRVNFVTKMTETAGTFDKFLVKQLAEELKELRDDRGQVKENVRKLEQFVVKSLAEEIKEFAHDKADLAKTKVKLVTEANKKFAKLRESFVARNSKVVQRFVGNQLGAEMTQLKEDIKVARENNFGRRIFEAFASEYGVTHLNENSEMRRLTNDLTAAERELSEARSIAVKAQTLVESKNRELRMLNERATRESKLNELLKTLSKDKAGVMSSLLESVQTEKLQTAFNKYLPAVLANSSNQKARVILSENSEVTGNRTAKTITESNTDIVDIRRLAGLQ